MKSDLIERQAAIDALGEPPDSGGWTDEWECGCRSQWELDRKAIENVPTAQPDLSSYSDKLWRAAYERGKAEAQRMRGRWMLDNDGFYVCDQCGEPCAGELMGKPRDRFCKWCGAKMNGGEHNDN